MSYQLYRVKIRPDSAFVTALAADTLFGHVCWAIRHQFGETKLNELLTGYTEDQPFLVVGQPIPENKLPRPHLPLEMLGFNLSDASKRKQIKKRKWIKFEEGLLKASCQTWGQYATSDFDLTDENHHSQYEWQVENTRTHNSLSRITGSTGDAEEGFSPYQRKLIWFHPKAVFDCYIVLDESRFSIEEFTAVFEQIGAFGYGKEASSGLGKFTLLSIDACDFTTKSEHNAYLTLGPCLPQGGQWKPRDCYYTTTVKFGRHGAEAVYMGSPFKNPVLMAETGSVFTPQSMSSKLFIGRGVTAISKTIQQTVHQGYAPVLSVRIEQGADR